ncbi:HD domain-containing protein [Geotalea uraniireducens]|uniref:Metal-dependent phosphohydrolase, HD sub domain n=1 Tax=Geotalea uraniireducens (strain Rf4) TaxID=351605 RepID=A5G6N6_GEOUR|nr:HD domain-containing protein [Geotalea uraniireducens]ABQ27454.1 metal-dependent phosphohydrolase, HD sub domain [Geotalea uraniireducens Rf4]
MNRAELSALKTWFADYCRSFYSIDADEQRNISLKELHTGNVCDNITRIARDELLNEEQQVLAEVIALFHDVGRFPQYRQYKTFKDSDSTNHAALGAKVLLENNVLAPFPKDEQDMIIQAVRLHNVFAIPEKLSADGDLFLKLIRDADKLDIWRVFIEYYALPESERASAVGLGFPDLPFCSDEVLACLDEGRMVNLSMLKTLNDFKLLQLSWVFDLNFAASFRLLKERDYIGGIAATLPTDGRIAALAKRLREYVEVRLACGAAA